MSTDDTSTTNSERPPNGLESVLCFTEVRVRRLYGLDHDLKADGLTTGVNVVYGSNASGKTTLARAIRMMIWPNRASEHQPILSGRFQLGTSKWRIDLDGNRSTYEKNHQLASPPSVPPESHHTRYHLYLPDLLAATDGVDDFAQLILQEAQGGVDVEGAASVLEFGVPTRHRNTTASKVEDARKEVRETKRNQEKLQKKDRSLDGLRQRYEKAKTASVRVGAIEKAVDVAEARADHEKAVAQVDTFSSVHEHLRGDEAEQLDELQTEIEEAQRMVEKQERAIKDAEEVLNESILPTDGLSAGRLETLRAMKDDLKEAEKRVENANSDLAETEEEESQAWKRLDAGIDREKAAAIHLPELQEVEKHAEAVEDVQGARKALDTFHRVLESDTSDPSVETLREAIRALHRWLQQPDLKKAENTSELSFPIVVSGGGVAILGGIAGLLTQGLALVLAIVAAVLGLVIVVLELLRARGSKSQEEQANDRASYQRNFQRTGLSAPEWTRASVEETADHLLDELRHTAIEEAKVEERQRLKPEYEEAAEKEKALEEERKRLVKQLGLNVGSRSLVWLVDRLSIWQTAREQVDGAKAALDQARKAVATHVEALNEKLDVFELGEVGSAADASGALKTLEVTREEFQAAENKIQRSKQEKSQAEDNIREAEKKREKLYGAAKLDEGDEDTLRELCSQHEAYEKAIQEESDAGVVLNTELRQLSRMDGYEPWMDNADMTALNRELEEARETASQREGLRSEIDTIERDVEAAMKDGTLEDKRADYRDLLDTLSRERRRDYEHAVGDAIAKFVQQETRDQGLPPVFERARELFASITNNRYELILDREVGRFRARDRIEERGFGLDALSSGTKVQLLLAVRVAFVESQEEECRLPLVLDETLANSDEEKAAAIIDAVRAVCESGRQVFYLTAQKDEVVKWRQHLEETDVPCNVVTLSDLKASDVTLGGDGAVVPEPALQVDAVALKGKSHDSLREVLNVSQWSPREPVAKLHLWYLIEETEGLVDLLGRGTETWGQLQFQYERAGDRVTPFPSEEDARIRARVNAIHSWREAWHIGRGKPISRKALEDCDAISENYLDRLTELADELNGDAEELLRELRERSDERTKGFYSSKADEFEAFCQENGYIDRRDRVPPEDMWQYVTADLSQELRDRLITPEDLEQLFERLTEEVPKREQG